MAPPGSRTRTLATSPRGRVGGGEDARRRPGWGLARDGAERDRPTYQFPGRLERPNSIRERCATSSMTPTPSSSERGVPRLPRRSRRPPRYKRVIGTATLFGTAIVQEAGRSRGRRRSSGRDRRGADLGKVKRRAPATSTASSRRSRWSSRDSYTSRGNSSRTWGVTPIPERSVLFPATSNAQRSRNPHRSASEGSVGRGFSQVPTSSRNTSEADRLETAFRFALEPRSFQVSCRRRGRRDVDGGRERRPSRFRSPRETADVEPARDRRRDSALTHRRQVLDRSFRRRTRSRRSGRAR